MTCALDGFPDDIHEYRSATRTMRRFGSAVLLTLLALLAGLGIRGCAATAAAGEIEPETETLERLAPTADYVHRSYGLLSYDGRTKTPRWTLERLDSNSLAVTITRGSHDFHSDQELPRQFRVSPQTYENTGFDRGHLAKAGYHRDSQEAFDATFAMSNVMPQTQAVNERVWARLEDSIAGFASNEGNVVWVLTAPVWQPRDGSRVVIRTIGPAQVWVPHYCAKCIYIRHEDGRKECLAWMIPNITEPDEKYDTYRVSTDDAEVRLGMDVWPNLTEQEAAQLEWQR